ncbi:hypothetical protein C8R43DRAFT_1106935 [Mycena crocata]|nr:hypothetical protein C8R43DRAFT_1106935 [Mycena crocata]
MHIHPNCLTAPAPALAVARCTDSALWRESAAQMREAAAIELSGRAGRRRRQAVQLGTGIAQSQVLAGDLAWKRTGIEESGRAPGLSQGAERRVGCGGGSRRVGLTPQAGAGIRQVDLEWSARRTRRVRAGAAKAVEFENAYAETRCIARRDANYYINLAEGARRSCIYEAAVCWDLDLASWESECWDGMGGRLDEETIFGLGFRVELRQYRAARKF